MSTSRAIHKSAPVEKSASMHKSIPMKSVSAAMHKSIPMKSATKSQSEHISPKEKQHRAPRTFQSKLDDDSFGDYCEGYEQIEPLDLYKVQLGGRIRYTTDELDDEGEVVKRHYRLGGILIAVDKDLRYCTLKNPSIDSRLPAKRGQQNKRVWSLQLRTPNTAVTLWYQAPATSAETTAFRSLLKDIDDGVLELKVKKKK